ncbi:MAG: Crp/Fnr family transcriptional regulator [Betaproteobacteria bacterium]|nr:Crp/Fnr family transcriptional regulator [Betaproteobacteria bacterium]
MSVQTQTISAERQRAFAEPRDARTQLLEFRPSDVTNPLLLKNQLLETLPRDVYSRIALELEPMELAADAVIFESGDPASHAYFPQDCVISLQCATLEGASVEFGMVGREGLLGIEALLENGRMPGRAVVVRPGRALRSPVQLLMDPFRQYTRFRSSLLQFYGALYAQVVQRSICHRVHTIEQQFCTWLLLMRERSGTDRLDFTHENVAGLLGGRREGVTIAVRRLRKDGLVRTGYRSLAILHRAELEARSCECYGAIRKAYGPAAGVDPVAALAGARSDVGIPRAIRPSSPEGLGARRSDLRLPMHRLA